MTESFPELGEMRRKPLSSHILPEARCGREEGTAGSIVGCGEWRRETQNMAKYIHLKVVESSLLTPSPDFGQYLFTCGEAIGAGQQVVFGMGPA